MSTEELDFSQFVFERIINQDNNYKRISFCGSFKDREGKCIIALEKSGFNEKDNWEEIVNTVLETTKTHDNDIYKKFNFLFQSSNTNTVRSQIIYPATEELIKKYSKSDFMIVNETPEFYAKYSQKYIESLNVAKKQWVYNILFNGAEKENVIYQDEDLQTGYILVKDYGMNDNNKDSLHLLAIVNRKDL